MRRIPASLHRILDFITITVFAAAPSSLGLTGLASTLSYVLAIVHLAMTLLTRFSPGEGKPVSWKLHGTVESVVGIALLCLPWLAGWSGTSQIFYMAAGAVILLVWALSSSGKETPRAAA
jgi:hypothetical protein